MPAFTSLSSLAVSAAGVLLLCNMASTPAFAGGAQYALDNGLAGCVAVEALSGNQEAVHLQLKWHRPIGDCGCKSAIAGLHWEHDNQVLAERDFRLRQSLALLFEIPESAPAGMRLYLGCGEGESRGI